MVSQIWGEYASLYDTLCHLRPYRSMIEDVVTATKIDNSQVTVLDAGCGTGNVLQRILQGPIVPFCAGVDGSSDMLAIARDKLTTRLMPEALVEHDLNTSLPFTDNSFGRVICTNVLYAVTDPQALLRELHRVLRPGSRLVLTNPVTGYSDGWVLRAHCASAKPKSYWETMDTSLEQARLLTNEAVTEKEVAKKLYRVREITWNIWQNRKDEFHFYSPAALTELVRACGFTNVSCTDTYAGISTLIIAHKE